MALPTHPVSTPNTSTKRPRRTRRLARRLVSAALVSVMATGMVAALPGLDAASPAAAASTWRIPRGSTYVALGDSTVAFNEDRLYIDNSRSKIDCWVRYPNTYPKRLAAARGLRLVDGSCGGATSKDYFRDQKNFVRKNARLVTLTLGSNDLRVFKSMDDAARTLGDAKINQAHPAVQKKVEDRLVRVIRDIGRRAPHAKIVVVGYLPLTNGKACPRVRTISAKESAQIKQKRDMIDRLLQRAGNRAAKQMPGRVKVLPLRHVSGHSACVPDQQRYISLLNLQGVWFHTNNAGHSYVARRIGKLLR